MEEAVLERLGLNKKEVKVYLALLGLGESSVLEISRKAKVERVLTYSILETLTEKGLVSFVIENKNKRFMASEPDKLLHQLKEKEIALMEVLPRLRKISKSKEKNDPSVEVLRGTSGVKAMITEILEVKKDYCVLSEDLGKQKLNFFFTHFAKSIERENLHERLLLEKKEDIIHSKNTLIRFLPKQYHFQATTIIYGDRVGIIIRSDPFLAIRIKSKDLAETYKTYFEMMWAVSKKE